MFTGMSLRQTRRIFSRALFAGLLSILAPAVLPGAAEAKTPGKTYCFNGICHTVKTIAEMVAIVGQEETLATSFYDDCKRDRYNPCGLTSSGEVYRPNDADNAASPIYPDGTVLLIRNPANGSAAIVRVNNAGPYWGKRKLDVSRGTAEALGFKRRGVAKLEVKVLSAPSTADARYKKNRRYEAVPGAIGAFASLAAAEGGMAVAMAKNVTPLNRKSAPATVLAAADLLISNTAAEVVEGETPADGLRAAARRAFGASPEARRVAPATLTADALYALIRISG